MRELFISVLFVFCFSIKGTTQIGRLALSPLQKIEQNIAKTDIVIEYSRPLKRDRKIFGGLVPYDQLWRTGANRNTIISFSQDVIIDKTRIKKGKYSIITKPGIRDWDFILYDEITNWDVPEQLDSTKIATKTTVKSHSINETIESLSITIGDFSNYKFNLEIMWEQTKITIPIQLTTKETMQSLIRNELEGPTGSDYYAAAVYQLESEKNYEKGLHWINQAIDIRNEPAWYDYRVKALLLMELNHLDNIKDVIKKGSQLAEEKNSTYGLSEFQLISKLIEK